MDPHLAQEPGGSAGQPWGPRSSSLQALKSMQSDPGASGRRLPEQLMMAEHLASQSTYPAGDQ